MGSDKTQVIALNDKVLFQSTLPHGERRLALVYIYPEKAVSIHAPTWGATGFHYLGSNIRGVSIHAPAWGATVFAEPPGSAPCVSIHAPAWGATEFIGAIGIILRFQSTLPHGERLEDVLFFVR